MTLTIDFAGGVWDYGEPRTAPRGGSVTEWPCPGCSPVPVEERHCFYGVGGTWGELVGCKRTGLVHRIERSGVVRAGGVQGELI